MPRLRTKVCSRWKSGLGADTLGLDHAVVFLARELPSRETYHCGRMPEIGFQGVVGLADIGRGKDGGETRGGIQQAMR